MTMLSVTHRRVRRGCRLVGGGVACVALFVEAHVRSQTPRPQNRSLMYDVKINGQAYDICRRVECDWIIMLLLDLFDQRG